MQEKIFVSNRMLIRQSNLIFQAIGQIHDQLLKLKAQRICQKFKHLFLLLPSFPNFVGGICSAVTIITIINSLAGGFVMKNTDRSAFLNKLKTRKC